MNDAELVDALRETTERLIDESRQLRAKSEELIAESSRLRRELGRLVAPYEVEQLRPAA